MATLIRVSAVPNKPLSKLVEICTNNDILSDVHVSDSTPVDVQPHPLGVATHHTTESPDQHGKYETWRVQGEVKIEGHVENCLPFYDTLICWSGRQFSTADEVIYTHDCEIEKCAVHPSGGLAIFDKVGYNVTHLTNSGWRKTIPLNKPPKQKKGIVIDDKDKWWQFDACEITTSGLVIKKGNAFYLNGEKIAETDDSCIFWWPLVQDVVISDRKQIMITSLKEGVRTVGHMPVDGVYPIPHVNKVVIRQGNDLFIDRHKHPMSFTILQCWPHRFGLLIQKDPRRFDLLVLK